MSSTLQGRRTHGGDVLAAVKLNVQGKMGLVNGDAQEILPGCGKHTYASQFVAVNTAGGVVKVE